MSLPQFPREPMRSGSQEKPDREIWQPKWNCFCCEDTGFINSRLVELVIPDYDFSRDKLPICQTCSKADWALSACEEVSRSLDWRFNAQICLELDQINRRWWQETAKTKFQQRIDLNQLAQGMSMRQRDRSWQEQQMAEQKHQAEIEKLNDSPDEDDWCSGEVA